MGIMVYSLLWVMQDLYHQPYFAGVLLIILVSWAPKPYSNYQAYSNYYGPYIHGVQIQSSGYAFAAMLGDGSVVTWGDADSGSGSIAVQGQLKTVQQIQASERAFAAILDDGSAVTWGHYYDSRTPELRNMP